MEKITAFILTAVLILSIAGCGNTEKDTAPDPVSTTAPDTSEKSTKKTQVIYNIADEEEDTSEEAMAYIKEKSPLYGAFLEKRRDVPLTFETSVTENGVTQRAGIYIKDEHAMVVSSYDIEGYETRTAYIGDKAYAIYEKEKKVYYSTFEVGNSDDYVTRYRLPIKYEEAVSTIFLSAVKEYEGVQYDCVTVSAAGSMSDFYFDRATGDICYIISGNNVSKVLTLENTVKESEFVIPTDYEMIDFMEFYESSKAQNAEPTPAES